MPTLAAPSRTSLIWVGIAILYVVWGSTYLGIRIAVETIPPFLLAGARFGLAGLVILGVALLRQRGRIPFPTRREWRDMTIIGAALMVGGMGLVALGEQTVPSGHRRPADRDDAALGRGARPASSSASGCRASRSPASRSASSGSASWSGRRRPPRRRSIRAASSPFSSRRSAGPAARSTRRTGPSCRRTRSSPRAARCSPARRSSSSLAAVRGEYGGFQRRRRLGGVARGVRLPDPHRQPRRVHRLRVAAAAWRRCRSSRPTRTSTRSSRWSSARSCCRSRSRRGRSSPEP